MVERAKVPMTWSLFCKVHKLNRSEKDQLRILLGAIRMSKALALP